MIKLPFFICLFLTVLLAVACSFDTPVAVLVKKQRIYAYNMQEKLAERLAVFVLLEDGDGRDDYKELILREDATGLEWTINRENTVFLQEASYSKNVQWIGSNKFAYPRRFFPAGRYTVTACDVGGNETIASFSLQKSPPFTVFPFDFTLAEEQWALHIIDDSACVSFSVIMLGADMQPIAVYKIPPEDVMQRKGALHSLPEHLASTRYIQCFAENADQSIGFLSKPMPFTQAAYVSQSSE